MLYCCESWHLTLREECKIRLFGKRILKRIFGHKRDEIGNKEGFIMRNFIVYIVHLRVKENKSRIIWWTGYVD